MRHFYPLLHIAAQNSAKLQIIKVSTKIYTLNFGTFFTMQNTFSQLFHDCPKVAKVAPVKLPQTDEEIFHTTGSSMVI